ncbi:2-amino-4-hydroxy-6-hydroxymethyldihydropteridine diphosphokinase [Nesterenkonia sp. F]|uniref:2-amino-4-hydroxy-6- hydroxymethyldihydropteridine diphosphokinase n=1 Tax=Nesterenkonia sp. F TaxID=795955 RepID=UPI000255D16A|nr:2-amino-4-hydroxy-6-hydroxymethyldihydropteridine diphosphokinase [Nesterenkonia sp. F]
MRSDRIRLTGIAAVGHHGVLAHETRDGQPFRVDAELHVDLRAAGRSDELSDTVDYSAVAGRVEALIAGEPLALIETLAHRLAGEVLAVDPRIARVEITVHKPEAPLTQHVDDVAVVVSRDRTDVGLSGADEAGETGRAGGATGSAPAGAVMRDPDLPASFAVDAVIALGSNLGDSGATLAAAVDALAAAEGVEVAAVSPRARTRPVGGPQGQPDFLNQVVAVTTTLSPHGLLDVAQRIESEHHRTREVRWGPRTLDVDIITYAGAHIDSPRLQVPHPRAHERAFVLRPWSWLDPVALLDGVPVRELAAAAADDDGVEQLDLAGHSDHAEGGSTGGGGRSS